MQLTFKKYLLLSFGVVSNKTTHSHLEKTYNILLYFCYMSMWVWLCFIFFNQKLNYNRLNAEVYVRT